MSIVAYPIASVLLVLSAHAQTASSLTCSPSIIAGGSGDPATCTITLSAAAPAGGTIVTLASSVIELAATVPQIVVPAGQTSATFTVATNSRYRRYSGVGFDAIISASANGTTRTATVSVTAQPLPADFPSGAQAGSQAVVDARVLAASLRNVADPAAALTHYQDQRIAAMNDIIVRNRNLGLEAVLQLAEERAPNGFARITDVLTQDELETTALNFKKAAGLDVDTVNSRDSVLELTRTG